MDINLLVVSLGNSRLAIGVFSQGNLEYATRIANDKQSDWPGVIGQAWQRIVGSDSVSVVGASVNPPAERALERIILDKTGNTVQWVGKEIDLPMPVLTQNPDETGVDRVVNMAAAFEQMGKACVVVDAGTAITVDCCNDQGEFLGGAIAPGVGMMLEALHEKTARLPKVILETPSEPIGKSTTSAIQIGIYYGVRGMVRELIENYATEIGFWPEAIATGGDAPKLFQDWELIHAVAPDLTLYGIALAYTNHMIKHGS